MKSADNNNWLLEGPSITSGLLQFHGRRDIMLSLLMDQQIKLEVTCDEGIILDKEWHSVLHVECTANGSGY